MQQTKSYELVRIILQSPKGDAPALVVLKSDRLKTHNSSALDASGLMEIRQASEELEKEIFACIEAHGSRDKRASVKGLRQDLAVRYEHLGEQLFRTLFNGNVRQSFDQLWGEVVDGRPEGIDGLRIRIEIDPRARQILPLAGIPWELLQRSSPLGSEFRSEALGHHRRAPVVRYLETGRTVPKIEVEGPLRILVAVPEPEGHEIWGEENLMASLAKLAQESDRVAEPQILRDPTLNDLHQTLRSGRHHVLHVIAHGGFEDEPGDGVLVMVDDEDGSARLVGARALADACKGLPDLALVVLCACEGAALAPSEKDPFLSMAPALLDAQVPAVVAMQYSISHRAAIELSKALYKSLADFDPVDVAVAEARLALAQIEETEYEWPSLVLMTRADDCRIIVPAPTFDLGICSFRGGFGQGIEDRCKDAFLDMSGHFLAPGHRLIRPTSKTVEGWWSPRIIDEIGTFLRGIDQEIPLVFEFAAHNSLVFATGWHLEDKSGLDIAIRQRGPGQERGEEGRHVPKPWVAGRGPVPDAPLWDFEEFVAEALRGEGHALGGLAGGADLVVTIGINFDVKDPVLTYLAKQPIPAGRMLCATIRSGVGRESVKSGAHALALAQSLADRIFKIPPSERSGVVHIFAAAPNSVMLYFGQCSKMLGAIQLYEHDYNSGVGHAYSLSLRIIPPRWEDYR